MCSGYCSRMFARLVRAYEEEAQLCGCSQLSACVRSMKAGGLHLYDLRAQNPKSNSTESICPYKTLYQSILQIKISHRMKFVSLNTSCYNHKLKTYNLSDFYCVFYGFRRGHFEASEDNFVNLAHMVDNKATTARRGQKYGDFVS